MPDLFIFYLTLGFQPEVLFSAFLLSGLLPQFVGSLADLLLIYFHRKYSEGEHGSAWRTVETKAEAVQASGLG